MTRVRITGGFLNIGRRGGGGRPDNELPGVEGPVDPDYGIEEGGRIDNELPGLPNPPPGVWPPLTPENPWRPVDPGYGHGGTRPPHVSGGPARPGRPERPDAGLPGEGGEEEFPPGTIWPPLPPGVSGTYWALVLVRGSAGLTYRYVVIDADARPDNELPEEPAPAPKK